MPHSMDTSDHQKIRQLFDDYLRMYESRDDRFTEYISEDFSGFTGSGDFLVKKGTPNIHVKSTKSTSFIKFAGDVNFT